MSRVLVTGANGFIGSNLCRHLLGRGWEVDALVRETSDLHFLDGLGVRLVRGDLERADRIEIPAGTTHVVHAAALVSDLAGDEPCRRGIYDTTLALTARLRAVGAPLRRFVYVSSALTLGFEAEGISEERPGRSAEFLPYVRHKVRTERALLEDHARAGLPLVILRPGDVYGANDRVTSYNILRGCERGAPLRVGSGRSRFGYCYVGNLCRATEAALTRDGVLGRAYTVTNGELPTWRQFFDALTQGLGKKRQRVGVPVPAARTIAAACDLVRRLFPGTGLQLSYYRIRRITTGTTYDISRTRADLGYEPDDDFRAQFEEVVRWYLRETRP